MFSKEIRSKSLILSWRLECNVHTLRCKSDSRRDPDTAFSGRTQQKMFPFQSFSSHTSPGHKELPVQQVICKRKQNLQMCRAPGARTAQGGKHHKKSWGSCIRRPAHKGRRIPERGQKRSKQLSPQTHINLGLCCHTESRKAWWKSNAATGTEVNVKRAGALEQERSTRLRGITHLHRRAKVLHQPPVLLHYGTAVLT